MAEVGIFLIGAIIVIGFLALYFFQRTKVPEVLLLILLGVLLGPVFRIVDAAFLIPLAPFFGGLALIIILFDGGLNLDLFKVLGELGPSVLFTVLSFVIVTGFATGVSMLFGWPLLSALLLGVILGGTASNFIIPVVARLNVSYEVKTLLSLESAINDTLTIVCTLALVGVISTNQFNLQDVSNSILGAFSIAAIVGLVAGLAWLKVMMFFHKNEFGYMLTLAVLFMLYAGVEIVKANGAIAVLVFGLIMGSAKPLQKLLDGKEEPIEFEGPLKTFHREISFFVRTFFFVYTGVIFNLNQVTFTVVAISVAVFFALIFGRFVSVRLFSAIYRRFKSYEGIMTVLIPRGLAAAVLASVPASNGVRVPFLEETVFTVLILTNILATVGVFYFERKKGTTAPAKVATIKSEPTVRTGNRPKIVLRK